MFVFFFFALVCAIAKFQGAQFTILGNRYDVVLTNSMSEKNEKYKDFLEGHDDQFKAFDLAVSTRIEKPEDLKVYDVIIYNDRYVGTNMHRIVGIQENGHDEVLFDKCEVTTLGEQKGIELTDIDSQVSTSSLSFQECEMVVYSELPGEEQRYNFGSIHGIVNPTIKVENFGNGKKITYSIKKESTAPEKMLISHSQIFDYSKERILSINIKASSGEINVIPDDLKPVNGTLGCIYNVDYRFEIRGDKADTSDGFYSFNEIQSKVVRNIPGMGYLIRFLNSIWGGIMFLLLGFLIILFQVISDHMDKKAMKLEEGNVAANTAQSTPATKTGDAKSAQTNKQEPVKPVNKPVNTAQANKPVSKPVNNPTTAKTAAKPAVNSADKKKGSK